MAEQQQKRAPSLWLIYDDEYTGDILMVDVFVPAKGLAKCTYYCCLSWNSGKEGGGYCGIQDHPDGRAFIFSLWDPQKVRNSPITADIKGPGTKTERFGGEGEGLKSMNFELGWKEDQWYTMVVRCWDCADDEATMFGMWVLDQMGGKWFHLITMRYPVQCVFFTGPTVSFLEDWNYTSDNYRCVRYKDGFKRQKDTQALTPFKQVKFQVNMHDVKNGTATENYNVHYDSTSPQDGICMESGGTVHCSGGPSCRFNTVNSCQLSLKCKPLAVQSIDISETTLTWELEKGGVPQFQYTVRDSAVSSDTRQLVSAVSSDTRQLDSAVSSDTRQLDSAVSSDTQQLDSAVSSDTRQLDSAVSSDTRQLDLSDKGHSLLLEVEDILGNCSSKQWE